jgi:hypothetical protein
MTRSKSCSAVTWGRWTRVLLVSSALGQMACRSHRDDSPRPVEAQREVLASGRFESVGKQARGAVELVRDGAEYQLSLLGVELAYEGPVHVFLVGADSAPDTATVDSASVKYDMGPLDVTSERQTIRLPSRPAPGVRSVVLWNPKYGANLAAAALSDHPTTAK